jgi:DNA-directed RNA polymerase specialized sigma24 family protein
MGFAIVSKHDDAPRSILERVTQNDRTAVRDCLDRYGNLVWAISKRFTTSDREAERLCFEIFRDIWKYSHRFGPSGLDEFVFIALVARRRIRDKRTVEKLNVRPENKFFRSFIRYARPGNA